MGAPDPVMAVHDHLRRTPVGQFLDPFREFRERQEAGSEKGTVGVFVLLPDVKKMRWRLGAQALGEFGRRHGHQRRMSEVHKTATQVTTTGR